MKNTKFILLLSLIIAVSSCNGKKDAEQNGDVVDSQEVVDGKVESQDDEIQDVSEVPQIPKLTIERVAELWDGIPDHGMDSKTKDCLSKSFYDLVDLGFDVPYFGIGDNEFLYYWYNGQDWDENSGVTSIKIDEENDMSAKVTVTYNSRGENNHTLMLIPEKRTNSDGQEEYVWVIDEFNNMHDAVYKYMCDMAQKKEHHAEDECEQYGEDLTQELRDSFTKEVNAFIKKFNRVYPDGVVKR